MKANKLRIGNLVCPISRSTEIHIPATAVVLKVEAVGLFEAQCRLNDNSMPKLFQTNDISGIPLTPEWLERLGFNLDRDHFKTEGRFPVYGDFKIWSRNVDSDGEWEVNHNGDDLTFVRYVHQLQNLYMALTGEELTLKEDVK